MLSKVIKREKMLEILKKPIFRLNEPGAPLNMLGLVYQSLSFANIHTSNNKIFS